MAESNVVIANRALQVLGVSSRISALDQDDVNARALSLAFVPVRDALLRKYEWNFAIRRVAIAKLSDEDAYEGLNQYLLPNDYARLLRRDKTGTSPTSRKDWQIENGKILTADGSPLEFRYLAKVTDPQEFDSLFDELLAYRLALTTGRAITGSATIVEEVKAGHDDLLLDARQLNSYENDAQEPPEDEWIQIMR